MTNGTESFRIGPVDFLCRQLWIIIVIFLFFFKLHRAFPPIQWQEVVPKMGLLWSEAKVPDLPRLTPDNRPFSFSNKIISVDWSSVPLYVGAITVCFMTFGLAVYWTNYKTLCTHESVRPYKFVKNSAQVTLMSTHNMVRDLFTSHKVALKILVSYANWWFLTQNYTLFMLMSSQYWW